LFHMCLNLFLNYLFPVLCVYLMPVTNDLVHCNTVILKSVNGCLPTQFSFFYSSFLLYDLYISTWLDQLVNFNIKACCWNYFSNEGEGGIKENDGGGIKENDGGGEFNMIYLTYNKNHCKCHNVTPSSTTTK
jgi:hypothetical protein